MLWINSSDQNPETGETVYLKLGFGHNYPGNTVVGRDKLDCAYAKDSEGKKMPLVKIFPGFYKFTLKDKGVYMIRARIEPGFMSIIPDGYKKGSKEKNQNAKSCFRYHMNAATLVQTPGSTRENRGGDLEGLQLVLLSNPSSIDRGDNISFKVLFNREIAENVTVLATYQSAQESWTQKSSSNESGIVRFKLGHEGPWLFQAKHTTRYRVRSVCDKHSYKTTFTIALREF